jgi:flagellar basal body-associated protein FliL
MQRNIVIFLIIIILFVVLALVGFGIYWAQTSMSRGARGGASETSGDEV